VNRAKLISGIDPSEFSHIRLDDFSRFKEKLIMINTLESLAEETDKSILKAIVAKEHGEMTTKSLKRALAEIVDAAIKRVIN
jgi:uncharacterized Fe-S cluster-containing radical SAM superfamily protein